MDESAVWQTRPARRLDGPAHLQCELVEPRLPLRRVESSFTRQSPQAAVRTDVVEPVIVDAGVRQVRRHSIQRAVSSELQKLLLAGRIELQHRRSELEALRPFGPATRLPASVDREDGCPVLGAPRAFEAADFPGGNLEEAIDPGQQIGWRELSVAIHQSSEAPYDM